MYKVKENLFHNGEQYPINSEVEGKLFTKEQLKELVELGVLELIEKKK